MGQGPLIAREIAERMLAAKGARDDASPKALRNLTASVQTSLQNPTARQSNAWAKASQGDWMAL
jgi:hypothetical protein